MQLSTMCEARTLILLVAYTKKGGMGMYTSFELRVVAGDIYYSRQMADTNITENQSINQSNYAL